MKQVILLLTVSAVGVLIGGCVTLSSAGESRPRERTPAAGSTGASADELRRILEGREQPTRRVPRGANREYLTGDFVIPVAGVQHHSLRDSFGDPRSGGRSHQGIDIMAPRWSQAVSAVHGRVESISTGSRSGKSLWISGADGRSYFYAHLEEWAEGVRRGTRVRPGDLVGYVGNSGNAIHTPPHLHFEIRDRRRIVNPYYELANARPVEPSQVRVASAGRESSPGRSLWQIIFAR